MNIPKPLTVTVAVIIHAVMSVGAILTSIPFLTGAVLPDDGPPLFIIVLDLIIGLLGLVTAWVTWRLKRWGFVSTIVLRALDGLAASGNGFGGVAHGRHGPLHRHSQRSNARTRCRPKASTADVLVALFYQRLD